ncbi:MAG: hypothetical protein U0Q03_03600 [Acidimicrobiales bacterium]
MRRFDQSLVDELELLVLLEGVVELDVVLDESLLDELELELLALDELLELDDELPRLSVL